MKRVRVSEKPIKNFLKIAVAIAVVVAFIMPGSALIDNEDKCRFPDTIISIFPISNIVKKGDTFTVSVDIGPGEPIRGVSFDYLYFDPTLVHVNNVTEGNLFDPYPTIFNGGTINNTNGTITNMYCYTDPVNNVTDSGIFCHISFTAQQKIGTSLLDLEGVIIENETGGEASVSLYDGKVAVVWSTTLYFNETSGENDFVVFGESDDANDGPPPDVHYDEGKVPAPMQPYIRGWFDDGLPDPYDYLQTDYRQYPGTEKTWDLYAEWEDFSSTPVNIMISWNKSEFDDCEYNSVVLMRYDPFDDEWDFAVDMLTEEEYVYSPRYFTCWLIDHFQIITAFDTTPPEITGVTVTHSVPKDTSLPDNPLGFIGGWENFTCTVIDNVVVDEVQLNLTYPDVHTEYYIMNKDGDTYYYNITLTNAGGYHTPGYTYHIWADDLIGNEDTSAPQPEFDLPLNADVNEPLDGKVHFMDLIAVSGMYGTGTPGSNCGWVRADVDNGGKVHFMDLIAISGQYGDQW